MAPQTRLELLRRSIGAWNNWRQQHQDLIPDLKGANFSGDNLSGADLSGADLSGADLSGADLSRADFSGANLSKADLSRTNLSGANLSRADLTRANFSGANLNEANLSETNLSRASLNNVDLIEVQALGNRRHIGPRLVDVRWGTTNLIGVDWSQVYFLGDEDWARQQKTEEAYKIAVRANRQLMVALQSQGLNENAAHFAYRSQVLQKSVLGYRFRSPSVTLRGRVQALVQWLFSWLLFLLAGYGYRPGRTFLTYLLVIGGFATTYYFLGLTDIGPHGVPGPHYLSWYEAFVVSMTAFHGRGFIVGTFSPGDPQALVAAIEAFVGLLVEVTFIATLTQRLFSK
ncbi:MAG: pentapeptide repeat-containing protein [Ktedonobacteraceae bacterium]|nr:pentapeptide repeat-containing protein [Ktedonobacteraceae bacterium]